MKTSRRLGLLPPYLFADISRTVSRLRAEGQDVISLGIGDPDLPTPEPIIEALTRAARDPVNHRYPESEGLPELRAAIADWYWRRFGVSLDPNSEVVPLIGSKEGIAHIPLALIDPGDIVLVPDPGYPVYTSGAVFAGGEVFYLPLKEERGFLPDLGTVPTEVARRAKLLWLNYPNNPTGATADGAFFREVVEFARQFDIVVCHDAAYTEVAFDGYRPGSFLQVAGARDVGVEFHSLSKTYNMTGWRVGMAVGNPELIRALTQVKTNFDSGIPQAIQWAAVTALRGPDEWVEANNRVYRRRRDLAVEALQAAGFEVRPPKAGFYLWVRTPNGQPAIEFALRLLEATAVVVTPGVGFGPNGEGYFRISLTTPDDRLEEALRRLVGWKNHG
ncbi:MAG: LL-diaminopimelate aminotransferase [Chloroflexota bacterium]